MPRASARVASRAFVWGSASASTRKVFELEPEARAYWCAVINDALGGDLFEKMMERAAVAALEEEPDVLPVMLWVAMQPKPLPEREEEVLKGFLQGFSKVCVSHAKRD